MTYLIASCDRRLVFTRFYSLAGLQIDCSIPAFEQYLHKIARTHCGANVFSCYGNDKDLFPASTQHFLRHCLLESIPGDQKAQSTSLAAILKFGQEDDKLILPAFARPVLAFGKD